MDTNLGVIVWVLGVFFLMITLIFGMRQFHRANVENLENQISKLLTDFSRSRTFLYPYYFQGSYNQKKITVIYNFGRGFPSVDIKSEFGNKHSERYSDATNYKLIFDKLTA